MASVMVVDQAKFVGSIRDVGSPARQGAVARVSHFTSLGGAESEELGFFVNVPNIGVNVQVTMQIRVSGRTRSLRVAKMRKLIELDLHDIAVMVGMGSFVGSAANVAWGLFSYSAAPAVVIIPLALAGFAGGRFITDHAARARHEHA
jgi:hypothetical protein